ncbi:MAG: gluconate 2-dehydrogenase subunit 3 family protein [Gemmatimonadota bacterium]
MSDPSSTSTSRRGFVAAVAGVGAAFAIHDWAAANEALAHAAQAVGQQPAPAFTTLSAEEAAVIVAAADRIIPSDDSPGATEAGVVYFVDRALSTFMKEEIDFARRGVRDLNTRARKRNRGVQSFAELSAAERDAVLKEVENTPFFGGLRYLTIVGTFADPSWGGNRDKVGWKMLGFDPHAINKPPFGYYDAQAAKRGR